MSGIVKKWAILVGLNSVVAFGFAIVSQHSDFFSLLAMFLGIATFVAIYSKIDLRLLRNQKHDLRRSLFWAAILKIFTQLYPAIEVGTGALSVNIVESILGKVLFFSTYFKTIVEGIFLSVIVFVLMMLVRLWFFLTENKSSNKNSNKSDS